jgi:hypothetical protein
MLNVQKYLLSHSLADLAREHGVYARMSTQNIYKFSLNYDQLEARDADPISQECRGLVLTVPSGYPAIPSANSDRIVGETEIMAWPMRRFFNYGQGSAAPVDFQAFGTRFFEKMDGTLCIVYWDRIKLVWSVATRSVPDADLPMDGFGEQTFSSLFWKAFESVGGLKDELYPGNTYCFELCTPDNQVVVRYDDYKVYLLASRWNGDGSEHFPEEWAGPLNVPAVQQYRFGSVDEMVSFVTSREAAKHEGIVVCDENFNRVKVKDPAYLALNKIKDSVAKSPRALMEIVLLGKEDDILPLIPPHIQEKMLEMKENLRAYIQKMDQDYADLHDPDRKTFALAVQAREGAWMGYMMQRWTGKCTSAKDFIQSQRSKISGGWADGFLDTLIGNCKKSG